MASVVWSLWKIRYDWMFNNVLINSPKVIAYKIVGFLTQWKKMMKLKEWTDMEDIILKLQDGLKNW